MNQYQQLVTAPGQSVQISFGIQIYSDITKPQLLFSAENFGASNIQVWLFPPDKTGSSGSRLGRFGISWLGPDGKFVMDLTVPTCFAKKQYNLFTMQINTGAEPSVRYFKDGILLTSDIDSKNQAQAQSSFPIPKNSPPFNAVKANCGETFKIGCGGAPSSLSPDAFSCFEGKMGAFNVRRVNLADSLISANALSILGDYLGLRGGDVCGDKVLGALEQCDDGNLFSNDGCGCDCVAECPAYTPPENKTEAYKVLGEETGSHVGAQRTISCQPGFDAFTSNKAPEDTVVCAPNQQWTQPNLACRQRCEELKLTPEQEKLVEYKEDPDAPGLMSGAARIVTCKPNDAGIARSDWGGRASQTVRCLDGVWSDINLLCEDSCASFPQLPAGLVLVKPNEEKVAEGTEEDFAGVTHGSRFSVQCDNKKFFPAASTIKDLAIRGGVEVICRHGKWSDINLRCFSGCNPYPVVESKGFDGKLVLSTSIDYAGGVNITSNFLEGEEGIKLLGSELDTLVPHGSYVELSCQQPMYSRAAGLPPMEKVYCADGHWTVSSVNCKLQCPSFVLPSDITPESVVVTEIKPGTASGSIRRIECAAGYSSTLLSVDEHNKTISTNSEDVKCLGGLWEQPSIRCKKTCDAFPEYPKKFVVEEFNGGVEHGARRQLSCAEGFHPVDLNDASAAVSKRVKGLTSQEMKCVDGKWTQRLIDCVRDCEAFPSDEALNKLKTSAFIRRIDDPNQTAEEKASTSHGASRLVACDASQGANGISSVTAEFGEQERVYCIDGQWSLPSLRCRAACPPPEKVNNASMTGQGVAHGSTREVVCAEGFASSVGIAREILTCRHGSWSKSVINCEPGCGTFPPIGPAYAFATSDPDNSKSTSVGSKRVLTCANGFEASAAIRAVSTCNANEAGVTSWSPVTLICGKQCTSEYNPGGDGYEVAYNGMSSLSLSEGATRSVTCAAGYSIFGGSQPAKVTCAGGQWSVKDLVCYKKCSEFPQLSKQYIVSGDGNLSTGGTREISCASGFFDSSGRERETVSCINGVWSKKTLDCRGRCDSNVIEALGLPPAKYVISGVETDTVDEKVSTLHGARRKVTCAAAFSAAASGERSGEAAQETVCENGKWAKVSLTCLPRCSPAMLPDTTAYLEEYRLPLSNGSSRSLKVGLEIPANEDGLIRKITCAPGYKAVRGSDPAESVCNMGAWSEANIVCKKACDAPAIPSYMTTTKPLPVSVPAVPALPANSTVANSVSSNVTAVADNLSTLASPVNATASIADKTVSDLVQKVEQKSSETAGALIQLKMLAQRGNLAAKAAVTSFAHGERVTLFCDENKSWFADGASSRSDDLVCVSGKWSTTSLTCQQSCPRPNPLDLGAFSPMSGKNAEAYVIQNSSFRPYFNETILNSQLALAADTVTIACASGYGSSLEDIAQTITCIDPGCDLEYDPLKCKAKWTPLTLECKKNCLPFEAPSSFKTIGSAFTSHGSSVKVSCAEGFSSANQAAPVQEVVCNDGVWSPLILECELPCPNPVKALAADLASVNMEVVGAADIASVVSMAHGSTVEIGCRSGFGSVSADDASKQTESLVCDRGHWSARTLTCSASCGDLPDLDLSIYSVTGTGNSFGSVRPVSCKSKDKYFPFTIFDDANQYVNPTDGTKVFDIKTSEWVASTEPNIDPSSPDATADLIKKLMSGNQKRSSSSAASSQVVCQASGQWTQNTLICEPSCENFENYKTNIYGNSGYVFVPSTHNSAETSANGSPAGSLPGDSFVVSCDTNTGYAASTAQKHQIVLCSGGRWSEKSINCEAACKASSLPDYIVNKHKSYYNIYSYINMPEEGIAAFAAADAAAAATVSSTNTTDDDEIDVTVEVASNTTATTNATNVTNATVALQKSGRRKLQSKETVLPVSADDRVPAASALSTNTTTTTTRKAFVAGEAAGRDMFDRLSVNIYDPVISHSQKITIQCAPGHSPTNINNPLVSNTVMCNNGQWTDVTIRCARDCPAYTLPTSVDLTGAIGNPAPAPSAEELASKKNTTSLLQMRSSSVDLAAMTQQLGALGVSPDMVAKMSGSNSAPAENASPVAKIISKSVDQPFRHSDWIELACDEGAGFTSAVSMPKQKIRCDDGRWSAVQLECMASCSAYELPNDAAAVNATDARYLLTVDDKPKFVNRFSTGQSVTVSCAPGYSPYGSSVSKEQSVCRNGLWTPINLRCRVNLSIEYSTIHQSKGGIMDATNPDQNLFAWRAAKDGSKMLPIGDNIIKTNKYPSHLTALIGGQMNVVVANPSSASIVKTGPDAMNFFQLKADTHGSNNFKCIGHVSSTLPGGVNPAPEEYLCVNERCVEEVPLNDCTTCDKSTDLEGKTLKRSLKWSGNDSSGSPTSIWGSAQWWTMTAHSGTSSSVPSSTMLRLKWSCIETCPSSTGWNFSAAEIDHIQTWSKGNCICTTDGCKDAIERSYDLISADKKYGGVSMPF
eukprot:GDKJ01028204.1.p1 GENE.GDKJ01028204.1~~GDKJ01028204.1.p1  ORF type:complete len:2593 (-),score=786.90 GDKJ01028204.1:482-7852(-)